MSTLATINGSDLPTNSRADINGNFSALNAEKMETSVLDTDTTLAANSDAKVATQKAVKAYVDAGGNVNASETTKGIVEEATDAEVTAGTATGGSGAKLFVSPAKLATRLATITSTKKLETSAANAEIASSTTNETDILSISIPANTLTGTNALRVKIYVSELSTGSAISDDLTFRLKYGSTTLATLALDNSSSAINTLVGHIECVVIANASSSSQRGTLYAHIGQSVTNLTSAPTRLINSVVTGTATEDATTTLNLKLTIQWGNAASSDTFTPAGYTVELIS